MTGPFKQYHIPGDQFNWSPCTILATFFIIIIIYNEYCRYSCKPDSDVVLWLIYPWKLGFLLGGQNIR